MGRYGTSLGSAGTEHVLTATP